MYGGLEKLTEHLPAKLHFPKLHFFLKRYILWDSHTHTEISDLFATHQTGLKNTMIRPIVHNFRHLCQQIKPPS